MRKPEKTKSGPSTPPGKKRRPAGAAKAATKAAAKPSKKLRWQLAVDFIENAIGSGQHPEGSRIPPETTIADQLSINRHTVRRAVAELVKKGVLLPSPQGGSIVAPKRASLRLGATERFAETLQKAGFKNSGKLLDVRMEDKPVPAEVARELKRPALASLIVIDHLHMTNDQPFALITTWASADRFRRLPDIYAITGHLDSAFGQLGVRGYRRHKAVVSCRSAQPAEVEHLGLTPRDIVLVLKLLYTDESGEAICYSIYRYAAERIEFVFYTDPEAPGDSPISEASRR